MRIKGKSSFHAGLWLWLPAFMLAGGAAAPAATNVAPAVLVTSAAQRAGTTFMDIDYRVNDPDDATVQAAALGFVDGGTNLSSVLKLNTLVEGTATNIGPNTPANTTKRLTWNVAADWNTNFGRVQVEVLAKDGRGLLPFHWITLSSNGPNPEVTINDRPIYDADLLPIWYWLIATGDPALQLVNGQIIGVAGSYSSNVLAQGTSTTVIGREFLWERLSIRSIWGREITRANSGRYGFQSVDGYSVAKGFVAPDRMYGWGDNQYGQASFTNSVPVPRPKIAAVAVGNYFTLVLAEGTLACWGVNWYPPPASATNVVSIAAGYAHCLALKADGTIIGWGGDWAGQATVPVSATNVVAIGAGESHSLALRADGTVVAWGFWSGQLTNPASATNVAAIAAGSGHNLALKGDGTLVSWGVSSTDEHPIPASATNVAAISAGGGFNLALRNDGSIVSWDEVSGVENSIPASATNVVAIAAGYSHSVALKADGTIVVWGDNAYGQLNVPEGLSSIDLIGVGGRANHVVVVDKRTP